MQAHRRILNRLAVLHSHLITRASSSSYPRLPNVSIHKERAEAEIIVPGYSYGDLDRTGSVNLWKVGQVGELARRSAHNTGHMPDFSTQSNYLFFMVGCNYTFTPAFYKLQHLYNPLRYFYCAPHIGTSSYTEYQQCYALPTGAEGSSERGELIHTEAVHVVTVDRNSRKPIPLPEPVHSFLSPLYSEDRVWEAPAKITAVTRPDTVKPSEHLVKWSNTDYYNHSNHTQYLKYAMDGIWDAGFPVSGKVSGIRGLYQGETIPGDKLLLYAWQPDASTIHVHVNKADNENGSETVFQATFNLDVS